jgi:hypothetical protein
MKKLDPYKGTRSSDCRLRRRIAFRGGLVPGDQVARLLRRGDEGKKRHLLVRTFTAGCIHDVI